MSLCLMEETVRQIIGKNIKSLRETLGLSQIQFAIVTGISRASIVNIESGKTGYNVNLLDNVLSFSNYSMEELSRQNLIISNDLRDELIAFHKESLDVSGILNEKPTIVYAIKYKLLKSEFLENPREINDIKAFFKKFGWEFQGTSIQNALKRMPNSILIYRHKTKKNTFVYLKLT